VAHQGYRLVIIIINRFIVWIKSCVLQSIIKHCCKVLPVVLLNDSSFILLEIHLLLEDSVPNLNRVCSKLWIIFNSANKSFCNLLKPLQIKSHLLIIDPYYINKTIKTIFLDIMILNLQKIENSLNYFCSLIIILEKSFSRWSQSHHRFRDNWTKI
jgi:hypothetical protein